MQMLENHKHKMVFILALAFLTAIMLPLILFSTYFFWWQWTFASLPRGATNGNWARAAVESDHPRFFNSIYSLAENSTLVLRVEILNKRLEVFGRGDTEMIWEQFYVYTLEVLEAYDGFLSERYTLELGFIEQGNLVEFMQFNGLSRRRNAYHPLVNNTNKRFHFDFIPADINIGDELVVFLLLDHAFLGRQYRFETNVAEPSRFVGLQHAHEHVNGRMVRNGYIWKNRGSIT